MGDGQVGNSGGPCSWKRGSVGRRWVGQVGGSRGRRVGLEAWIEREVGWASSNLCIKDMPMTCNCRTMEQVVTKKERRNSSFTLCLKHVRHLLTNKLVVPQRRNYISSNMNIVVQGSSFKRNLFGNVGSKGRHLYDNGHA